MDGLAIAGGVALIILFVIVAWQVYNRKRRPQLQCSVVIADSLQPQVVCRSVPCQHPYYRVISEYSGKAASQELSSPDNKPENEEKKSPTKFDYIEWSRSLSLNSISRKSSQSSSNTRRCSASDVGRVIMPTTKTKPYFVA